MNKEMELLLSEKEITFGDKRIIVKRFSLLDTIRIASQASGVASKIINDSEASANALSKLTYNGQNDDETAGVRLMGLVEILSVVGEDGVNLIKECIYKATNLEYEEVEKIDSVDGVDLLFAVYEVNKGFFSKLLDKTKKKEAKTKKQ